MGRNQIGQENWIYEREVNCICTFKNASVFVYMEAQVDASFSGNFLPHTDHKHYPSGFETSKHRDNTISIHISRKKPSSPIKERDYFDPFHSRGGLEVTDDVLRPSSPYKIDEYGDVAGQYFRDIAAPRTPAKSGRRIVHSRDKPNVLKLKYTRMA